MKTARYSDAQIMSILKQAEGGVPVSGLCREHGMSSANFAAVVKCLLHAHQHSQLRHPAVDSHAFPQRKITH